MPMACRGVVTVSKNVSDTSARMKISAPGADIIPFWKYGKENRDSDHLKRNLPATADNRVLEVNTQRVSLLPRTLLCYNLDTRKGVVMTIAKQQVLELIKDLPEEVDIDEIIYRLYLRQKLESAEKDVREGRLVSHEEVVKETSKWFEK